MNSDNSYLLVLANKIGLELSLAGSIIVQMREAIDDLDFNIIGDNLELIASNLVSIIDHVKSLPEDTLDYSNIKSLSEELINLTSSFLDVTQEVIMGDDSKGDELVKVCRNLAICAHKTMTVLDINWMGTTAQVINLTLERVIVFFKINNKRRQNLNNKLLRTAKRFVG